MPPRKIKASSSTETVGKGRTRKAVISYEESPGSNEFSDEESDKESSKKKKPRQASAAGKGKKRKAAISYKESPASSEMSAEDSDKGTSAQKKKKSRQTDAVGRGKKRKAAVNYEESPVSSELSAEDSDMESSVQKKSKQRDVKTTKKTKESKAKPTKSRSKIPDVSLLNFSNEAKTPKGTPWNVKVSSWNVNGVRAWLEKDGLTYLHHEQPDIFCIQETKCPDKSLPEEVKNIDGYHCYWLSGDKDGYSGVGLLSKEKPIDVSYGIGISKHDKEGRAITAEYDKFFLVTSYVPNAGKGLVRLDYRMDWDKDFRKYLKDLESKKPVILCGDLNVAHEEIDLANPKTNKRNAGFTQEERDGFSSLLKEGFIDSFRELYPNEKGAYTFWTYMMNARAKNVGWRLDYFVISKSLLPKLCDSVIRKDVHGSDHCPVTLFLAF